MTVAHFTEKIKVNGRDSSDLNPPPLPTSLAGRRSFLDSPRSPGGQPQRPHFLWKWLSLSWQQGCHPRVSEAEATQTHVTGSENTGSDVSLESGSIYSHPCRTGLCRQQSHTRWPAIQPNSQGRPYANSDIAAPRTRREGKQVLAAHAASRKLAWKEAHWSVWVACAPTSE